MTVLIVLASCGVALCSLWAWVSERAERNAAQQRLFEVRRLTDAEPDWRTLRETAREEPFVPEALPAGWTPARLTAEGGFSEN